MRFGDFLRATVLLCAASATLLGVLTALSLARELDTVAMLVSAGWWLLAVGIGVVLGRRAETSAPIASLLAAAKAQTTLPELRPALTLLNRLWVLLVSTLLAAGVSFLLPQASAIAAGFAMIWALAWRRQELAVAAVEERDGVRFYVDRTSSLAAIRLVRTPGFGGDYLAVDGQREAV